MFLMQKEFEAKVLEINKDEIRKKMEEVGARIVYPERLFTRMTFDTPELHKQGAWVRVRDGGDKVTMSLKIVEDKTTIHGMKEVELTVSSADEAKIFLEGLGLTQSHYQQNYRERWEKDGVEFDIDTWPKIPPFLEIEAKDEQTVKDWFQKLGFDYSKAVFGSADIVYEDRYGIDVLKIKKLTFEN